MLRRSPLWLFLLAASVFPLSCSEDDPNDSGTGADSGTDSGTGGMGGSDGSISLDGGDGEGGGSSVTEMPACESFVGLENCGSDELTSEVTPVNILLVIDKSGSMDSPPTESSTTTLWEATTEALTTALDEANEAVSFGLQLYPAREATSTCSGENCCVMPDGEGMTVPIASGEEPKEEIATELGRTAPGGGTPTGDALSRAYQYFLSGEGADLKGDRFVLLATDGGPNCNFDIGCEAESCTRNIDGNCGLPDNQNCCGGSNNIGCLDDQRTLSQIERLREIDVDTFVIGLTGTEQYAEQLNAFAEAGGQPREGTEERYFKVDAAGSAEGLTDVLNEITTELVQTCDLQLTEEPAALDEINVAVNCNVIEAGSAPEETMGQGGQGGAMTTDRNEGPSYWWLDQETSPPTVRIGGEVCGEIEGSGVDRIDIITGCATIR